MKEIWKDIPKWEGLYQVSNLGRIKSVKRDKVKVLDINNAGYARVQLCDDKRRKKYFVHRLVAQAFISGYFENAQVNHIDMDRTNNIASNLEWVTPSENQKKAINIRGLHEGHFQKQPYKLTLSTGQVFYYDTIKDCARSLGLSKSGLYLKLENGGYLKEFDGYLSKCEMPNDHSYKEVGKKSSRNGKQR